MAQPASAFPPARPSKPSATIIEHPSQPVLSPIPDIMPGGSITLLAGASGVGKTAFVAGWARTMLDGGHICGHAAPQLPAVGVLAVDRRWASHAQWFTLAGAADIVHYSYRDDPTMVWEHFHQRQKLPLLFKRGLAALDLPRGSCVIVDPISMFIPGNLLDYKTTAVGLALLDEVINGFGVTVLGICHIGKQKNDVKQKYTRPQDRILGSAALAGFTDTQMYLLGPEETDEEYYQFGWVPHHAPAETFEFLRNEQGLFVPYESHDTNVERQQLLEQISSEADGTHAHELTTWAGEALIISKRTCYRHLAALEHQGKIYRLSRGRWRKS